MKKSLNCLLKINVDVTFQPYICTDLNISMTFVLFRWTKKILKFINEGNIKRDHTPDLYKAFTKDNYTEFSHVSLAHCCFSALFFSYTSKKLQWCTLGNVVF